MATIQELKDFMDKCETNPLKLKKSEIAEIFFGLRMLVDIDLSIKVLEAKATFSNYPEFNDFKKAWQELLKKAPNPQSGIV